MATQVRPVPEGYHTLTPYLVVEGADKVITFKIDGSSYPNWTGSEQKRNISAFTPDQFTWTLAASVGGTAEVTWKRVK